MASSSLDTASLFFNPVPDSQNPRENIQRELTSQFLFYTTPTDIQYITPPTGSSEHAGKPTII